MKIKGDTIIFSSGREIDVNCGIIGIDLDFHIYEGYDGVIFKYGADPYWGYTELTKDEQIELADHMIGLWNFFKERAQNGKLYIDKSGKLR